ncbi:FimV/HubP family polar landmark protein [Stenotrophomonas sp. C3(2023)]|uniref:FimV/HubP family polar landmark protein n=1 Tax=Stenotrophomonas sp. C3(2023) TaxID=3080277 RepID=UPI00293C4747|nr:FimV/HubP family polar landmark protein [Stenotrophomonas sp. C3(2023)]MDV3468184.1 FimV/HubP family polar landmark protein [Stenotrophomonas sp. C3(2023)]
MNRPGSGAMRPLTYITAALLALASSSALALGLGDIRVLSRPGQPLLAEIPVITADPGELQNLRVGLASAATFERIGLQAPSGLVRELQFELVRNAQGRAVVQVTSQAPVDSASLSFLVEADWGQGRLVREYSALVDRPDSAVAVTGPDIVAPAAALPDAIVRAPAAGSAAPASSAAAAAANVARAAPARPAEPTVATPALDGNGRITVQAGQTLSQIAQDLSRGQQVGRDQAMIALLRANPEAFIRGNVNLLRQGAVLRVPDAGTLAGIDRAEAAAMVREHVAQWRQARTIPQPAATTAAAAPAVATAAASGAADARLEIAPAAASDTARAGSTTGTGDGNEGDMLANEQLRQAREDVATREAEIDELKQRVAELEKLQQQQQALVSLKDTELAAAQARLAQAPAAASAAGGPWYWLGLPVLLLAALGWWLASRRKPSPLPPQVREQGDGSAMEAGVAAGAGLDVMAERAPWLEPVPQDDAPVADAGGENGTFDVAIDDAPDQAAVAAESGEPAEADVTPLSPPAAALVVAHATPETLSATQVWPEAAALTAADPSGQTDPVPAYARHAEQHPDFRGVFDYPHVNATAAEESHEAYPSGELTSPLVVDTVAPADAEAGDIEPVLPPWQGAEDVRSAGHDRLELAIAYLDLGDAQTARTLLQEVTLSDDPQLQAQARELLARLD